MDGGRSFAPRERLSDFQQAPLFPNLESTRRRSPGGLLFFVGLFRAADDNFFHAAYGGSFLNHQFLVAAAAPVFPDAAAVTPSSLPTLDAGGQLALDPTTGKIVHDGKVTPINATFDKNYAVNTIFSTNLVPTFKKTTDADLLPSQNDADPGKPNYTPTIGDRLDQAGVSWKWYSGGWDAALDSSPSNPAHPGVNGTTVDPNFQWHHQPLAYYDNVAPWLPNGQRNPTSADHLQDEKNFFADLSAGDLPAVSLIKPLGPDNEHPGYASLLQGQQHVADVVHAVQNSPDWAHTAVIITYDENGGRWDHVAPPANNGIWGDGSRVPAIVLSPYAKQGFVDHAEHDTLSILKTVEQRFGLAPLSRFDAAASSLASGFQLEPHASIGRAYVQPSADTPGTFTLIVQGTEGDDHIRISPDGTGLRVRIEGKTLDFEQTVSQPISRLEVYGQGGNDHVVVDDAVTVPAFLFGGAGNDVLRAGGGPSVVVGGAGNDVLLGGDGPSILIGGKGHDVLKADSADTILIGGFTDFVANLAALRSLPAELSRTDETFSQKVAHLDGGATGGANGTYALTPSTVHDDHARDLLKGGTADDWFFAALGKRKRDTIVGEKPGDEVTVI